MEFWPNITKNIVEEQNIIKSLEIKSVSEEQHNLSNDFPNMNRTVSTQGKLRRETNGIFHINVSVANYVKRQCMKRQTQSSQRNCNAIFSLCEPSPPK